MGGHVSNSSACLLASTDPKQIYLRPQIYRPCAGSMMPSGHSHSGIPACYLFVISHLLTTAIVAGEVTSSEVALASLFEGVIMNFKQKLMACTALLGVLLFHPATAGAQSADSAKIERLERQTELLQRQLKELQAELAQTRRKTEKVEAKVEAAPARYSAPPPMVTKGP